MSMNLTLQRWDRVVAFFEFWGLNSFAGHHVDEQHAVTLFDISVHRKGLLEPRTFIKLFEPLGIPRVLHVGNFNRELQKEVEQGTLEGMTFEGVVAKGSYVSPGRPLMFKWKSKAWLDRLRADCATEAEFKLRQ